MSLPLADRFFLVDRIKLSLRRLKQPASAQQPQPSVRLLTDASDPTQLLVQFNGQVFLLRLAYLAEMGRVLLQQQVRLAWHSSRSAYRCGAERKRRLGAGVAARSRLVLAGVRGGGC